MSKSIEDLREALFSTIEAVRNGSLDVDKARAINDVAKSIVDTARVEVDYLRIAGGGESEFLSSAIGKDNLPNGLPPAEPGNGIVGITRHQLRG